MGRMVDGLGCPHCKWTGNTELAREAHLVAHDAREATGRRNIAIHRMHADGESLRAIGKAVGLTHGAIAKILQRVAG